jgi:hypothetical protein
MYCRRCGFAFSVMDYYIGNCRKVGTAYEHTHGEDCDDSTELTSRSISRAIHGLPLTPTKTPVVYDTGVTHVPPPVPVLAGHDDDDIDDDDAADDFDFLGSSMDDTIRYGHANNRYWLEYAGHRYEGRRTKHIKGVLLAIKDVYGVEITIPNSAGYKASTHRSTQPSSVHRIIVGDVLDTLPAPFQMRYLREGKWVLQYKGQTVKERIRAVLAGYVVAIRTFQA